MSVGYSLCHYIWCIILLVLYVGASMTFLPDSGFQSPAARLSVAGEKPADLAYNAW